MRSVLVTGGAGYIGSHTCKALAAAGYEPVTIDNLSRGHREFVRWGPLIEADISDRAKVLEAIQVYRPVAAIHFAAFAYVGESVSDPMRYWMNNVASSTLLCNTLIEGGVKHLVFSSTCAVYGIPEGVTKLTESHPCQPINPYGATKLAVERMLSDLEMAGALHSVRLRYFNAAGADPEGDIGEDHCPETHLIPLVLHAVATGNPVTVFGDDYETPDGTCVRDYVHIADLADAHVRAIDFLAHHQKGAVFNLGTGRGFSVREVLAAVERVTGSTVPFKLGARRSGDPPSLVADARHATNTLGWQPRYSALDQIVATAWNWHQQRHGWKVA